MDCGNLQPNEKRVMDGRAMQQRREIEKYKYKREEITLYEKDSGFCITSMCICRCPIL